MTQTVSLIDNLIADTSYGISGGPAWLTVTSANGGATVSGTGTGTLVSGVDQLTFSALYSAVIPAPTVGTPTAVTVTLTAPNEFPLLVTVKFYLVNASTLSTNPTSTSFATSYAKSTIAVPGVPPTAVSITVSNSNGSVQNYSVSTPTPSWLTCTPTNGTAGNSITDQLSCSVNTSSADTTPAGPQTATVHLSTNNGADTTFTITLTITTTVSPLSSTAFPITLNYLVGGPANQASLTGVPATILSSNTVYEPYTANSPTLPTWLTVTPASSRADIAHSDTALFQVVPKYVPAGSGTTKFTVHLAIIGNPSEPDLTVVVTLNVTVSQLTATQPAPLTYVKGTGGTNALYTSVTLTTATGTVSFTVDPATLPLWLTATTAQGGSTPYGTGSANSGAGATVYFNVVTQTAATMATGNYTQNIGFSTAGYADLLVPVTLLISNGAATLGLQETSTLSSIVWGLGTPVPIPTWTPYSSDEPIPFSASCSVVASDTHWVPSAAWAALGNYSPCSLNAAAAVTAKLQVSQTVTGVAFTTGYPIVASLDPGLFASTLGNTVSVTVQVLQTSGGTGSISKTYTYSLQPVNPTITSVSPASAAPIASSTSLVVLVTGTNFVGQQNIKPSSNLAPTLVFLGTSPTALTSGVVVINTTQLQITIPQTSFPGIPSGQTSTKLTIGIANQTGTLPPSQATATGYLTVTTAPVIYGITSTATYVQPTLGSNPSFAPYELISIFGDNFGLINLTPNFLNAAPNSYNLFPTALTLSGTAAAKNLVQLTVTFTPVTGKGTFTAPILFANQNQINAIVPSGVVIGSTVTPSTYNVTVTSGAATNVSTVFPINVLPADPGIFTLASDGSGQGAIINLIDGTINKTGNEATAGQYVSLYLTGLGAPESAAVDTTGNGVSAPLNCVEINGTKAAPGYIQVVDTAVKASSTTTAYVPPTPSWTTIDGAVITYGNNTIISGLPPCMTDTITVTFGTGGTAVTATTLPAGGVTYAGFVSGSVAGLYQINVQIPSGISGLPGSIPVTVTIPPYTSPLATATIALK
jgi:uncharacterized protein (TIGR03437 family)